MKNKILITGGAGFIGRSLYFNLNQLGAEICILDVKDPNFTIPENTIYFQQDINNKTKLQNIFKAHEFSGVVHLAAISRVVDGQDNPEKCREVNVKGTLTLLNAIKESKQRPWLIFGSSREVYGEPSIFPVREKHPTKPVNVYGLSKLIGEQLFVELCVQNDLRLANVRFSNVYGNEWDINDRVIPKFSLNILNDQPIVIEGGEQLIDFTHIDDTVQALVQIINLLNNEKLSREVIHLSPGQGWSLQQLVEIIEYELGKKATVKTEEKRNYDVERFVGDPSTRKRLLGIERFIPLEEGIKKYLKVLNALSNNN